MAVAGTTNWQNDHSDLVEALEFIDPSCDYGTWYRVGMALKKSGLTCEVWDTWSSHSDKYKPGECGSKWRGFKDIPSGVGSGTIVRLAEKGGWVNMGYVAPETTGTAPQARTPVQSEKVAPVLDLPHQDVPKALDMEPADQLRAFLGAMRGPGELVNVVTNAKADSHGKLGPCDNGTFYVVDEATKRAEGLLRACDTSAGAWVRMNPTTNGKTANADVTAYRFTLVEADHMPKADQLQKIADLQLPCAAIVDSGNRSYHAIVKVDADNAEQYAERVRFLYDVCEANGLHVDRNNKNESRLTRLPGATRGKGMQRLMATDYGTPSWFAWRRFVGSHANGAKPSLVILDMADYTGHNTPHKRTAIIGGLLREGGKMGIMGPPKCHKSMEAIRLALALATGGEWMGHACVSTRVLYVNTELDQVEFANRVEDVRKAMSLDPSQYKGRAQFLTTTGATFGSDAINIQTLTAWATKNIGPGEYGAIIIDPVYKLEDGDEDTAGVNAFLHSMDLMRARLRCSIIYTHHTSKGGDAYKTVYEQGRGSGNWGGDADAVIGISELVVNEKHDAEAWDAMTELGIENPATSAYRIRFGTRSFKEPKPVDVFKTYPLFTIDKDELLKSLGMRGSGQVKGGKATADYHAAKNDLKDMATGRAIEACKAMGKDATRENVYDYLAGECDRLGIDRPKQPTFKGWTSRADGLTHYRTDMDGGGVLRPCQTDKHGRVVYEEGRPQFLARPEGSRGSDS